MRLAIASLPCLSLTLVGCSSYNAPKAAPTPLPVPTSPAATPMFSVVGGMYTVPQTVTISDATAGAIVYYTTNGSAPTPSSNQYAGPVTVGSSETLMATAIAPGHLISAVASASYTITPQPPPPNGTVLHGQVPLAGAHVYLFAANDTGYGKASVSLLEPALAGASDSIGAYVTTGTDGSFVITGDYTCRANTQVYLYALGGDPGSGNNPASGLLAVLGNCPNSGSFSTTTPKVTVNEVSTIAAAYAIAALHVHSRLLCYHRWLGYSYLRSRRLQQRTLRNRNSPAAAWKRTNHGDYFAIGASADARAIPHRCCGSHI